MTARRSSSWSVDEVLTRVQGSVVASYPSVNPAPLPPSDAAWGLTGSTGWWGRHAARALLRASSHTLVVPVRSACVSEGLKRLQSVWTPTAALRQEAVRQGWWDRVEVVPISDLAHPNALPVRPLFGVIHAAADLSLAFGLDEAWSANVIGALRAWNWAIVCGASRFDHVSTLSVWVAGETPDGRVRESDDLRQARRLSGGYAASKWAAEVALLERTGLASPCLAIHRLGLISYSSSDGWAPGDALAASARAWRRWGKPSWAQPSPRDAIDWSPVEHTVDGLLAVAQGGGTGAFHWASQEPIPAVDWLAALERQWGSSEGDWPMGETLGKAGRRAWGRWAHPEAAARAWWHDVFQSDRHRYDAARAEVWAPRWTWSPETLDAALSALG